jgi:hypothetical protein
MESEPSNSDLPKRRRRWFQFSLRTLLVFTLIVGFLFGRLGRTIEEKYDKQREVEEQKKSWDEARTIAATIKRQLGVSSMACSQLSPPAYVWVSVNSQHATDATLERLGTIPRIGSLIVSGGQITDAGLRHLSNFTELQRLVLHTKLVTDAGLPHLMGMTKLRNLDLKSARVTEAGVNKLQKALPNCDILFDCETDYWESSRPRQAASTVGSENAARRAMRWPPCPRGTNRTADALDQADAASGPDAR